MRADRAPQARGDDAAARHAEPGRRAPQPAARDRAVSGRPLHLPGDRDPLRRRQARRRAGLRLATRLPPGALEGLVSDPLRRPAAPGAPRRLDLPGPARRGARAVSHHDVIVVGIGMAGLTAATRLAESGARVLVLAKGVGATHLSPCTIDVLGYAPERVDRPAEALSRLGEGHPYSLVGAEAIGAALDWFKARVPGYSGGLDENLLLPTAIGALRPTAAVPESMAAGDMGATPGEVLVVGFRALKDFHAHLLADNLGGGGAPRAA